MKKTSVLGLIVLLLFLSSISINAYGFAFQNLDDKQCLGQVDVTESGLTDNPFDENNPFYDVINKEYYYDAVLWAVKKKITNGTSDLTFSPNLPCTRGQIVTFLWRSQGCPKSSAQANFIDLIESEYYVDAVSWAVENGITDGVDELHFAPEETCTRAQAVTFLYRVTGEPVVDSTNTFVDIPNGEWFTDAVIWASELGITNGTDTTHFSPNDFCTRGQIVTFLYRYFNQI